MRSGLSVRAADEVVALAPMIAVIGALPDAEVEGEYAYETLWNGARTLIHLPGDGTVRLISGMGLDVTADYPDLLDFPGLLPGLEAVLDGEIVALDGEGRPSVERLQQRMSLHHPHAVEQAATDLPVRLMVFDVLYLWQPVLHQPYTARRALLDDLALSGPRVSVPACWPAMAAEAMRDACEEGYDGIIAKRLSSPYLPGRRSRDWIKIKNLLPRPHGTSR